MRSSFPVAWKLGFLIVAVGKMLANWTRDNLTIRSFVFSIAASGAALSSACAFHQSAAIPAVSKTAVASSHGSEQNAQAHLINPNYAQVVPNKFAAERRPQLGDADLDRYIDSSVTGADRTLARSLMRLMPPSERGDFVYLKPGNQILTNNLALLPYVKVTMSSATPATTSGVRPAAARQISSFGNTRKPKNYPSCIPQTPSSPMGALAQMFSYCGFSAGFAFVQVPGGYTNLEGPPNEAGYLYFEIFSANSATNTAEGGFEYDDDNHIHPYAAVSNQGRVQINNSSATYQHDNLLGTMTGVTQVGSSSSGAIIFTVSGLAPSAFNPALNWLTGTPFTLQNAAWQFIPVPASAGFWDPGYDPVGNATGCQGCSTARVTTIAQNAGVFTNPNNYQDNPNCNYGTWCQDGSFFGVDLVNGYNVIWWVQVAFGTWGNDCVENSNHTGWNLCTFYASSDPDNYFGGSQVYPTNYAAQTDYNTASGRGPWESRDGIDLGFDSFANRPRTPLSALTAPLPPTCVLDSYGYCLALDAGFQSAWVYCYNPFQDQQSYQAPQGSETYFIQVPGPSLRAFTWTSILDSQCNINQYWSPSEPSAYYQDPNLP